MKWSALFILLFAGLALGAQPKLPTLVYRLDPAQALRIYQEGWPQTLDSSLFDQLLDRHPAGSKAALAPGHYLLATAGGEALKLELQSRQKLQVLPLNHSRDLALLVVDGSGLPRADARLSLGGRPMRYDPFTDAYRLKNPKKGGWLEVQLDGETAFFQVAPKDDRSLFWQRLQRFSRSTPGYVVTTPYRWCRQTVRYFVNGIRGNWRPPFERLFRARRNFPLKGYLVLSQPRYRPGDTLRLSAYAAHVRGRPWRRPLQLSLSSRGKVFVKKELQAQAPGVFHSEIVLGDSLPLDYSYQVELSHPDRRRWDDLSESFQLEDYELDQVKYQLEAVRDSFGAGEAVLLRAWGEDYNGLSVADGQLKLVVLTDQVSDYYVPALLIPDTLWTLDTLLDAGDTTLIRLPDSIFPAARTEALVKGRFFNANGELQDKEIKLKYNARPGRFQLRIEGGALIAEYLEKGQIKESTALLKEWDQLGMRERRLTVPLREPLNLASYRYALSGEGSPAVLDLKYTPSGLRFSGSRQADSIRIQFLNPQRLSLRVSIRDYWQGEVRDSLWTWSGAVRGDAPVFVHYQYLWAGENKESTETFQPYKKQLNLHIDQPGRVRPGESVRVNIQASDYRGRPAKGVNLSAGAINAQFGEEDPFSEPEIPFRPAREPLGPRSFSVRGASAINRKEPMTLAWLKAFQAEDSLYYQLRFPSEGVKLHYEDLRRDSAFRLVAQFAPYVVRQGRSVPVYFIYCNRNLVYAYDRAVDMPYSFIGFHGYNQLVLRTADSEYTLDSILLKPGYKLEISIDADRYAQCASAGNIRRQVRQPFLTEIEKSLLREQMLILRQLPPGKEFYFWQNGQPVHRLGREPGILKLGPFRSGENIHFVITNGWTNSFLFEPGYAYVLERNRERLYQENWWPSKMEIKLPSSLPSPDCRQTVLLPKDVVRETPQAPAFHWAKERKQKGRGQYVFHWSPIPQPSAILLQYPDTTQKVFYPATRHWAALKPGNYHIRLFFSEGRYLNHSFSIRPDTLLYQDLSGRELSIDSAGILYRNSFQRSNVFFLQENPERTLTSGSDFQPFQTDGGQKIRGQLLDENGEPLIGASILIKGTTMGTVTDIDGAFSLNVPAGSYTLVFTYVGFTTQEINGHSSGFYQVALSPSAATLSEVVVTGYGVSIQRDAIHAISVRGIAAGMEAQIAGIAIEGQREEEKGPSLVPNPDTEPLESDEESLPSSGALRRDFRDYAFWQPHLQTDAQGEASFTAKYPDQITRWRTFVLGMDRRARAGLAYSGARSYRELMAQLALPRFLVAGDRTEAIGKVLNYSGDSLQVRSYFSLNGAGAGIQEGALGEFRLASLPLQAGPGQDSLCLAFLLENGDYRDGEQRCLPVFPLGSRETVGRFFLLEKDTQFQVQADPRYGPLRVYAESNLLELIQVDLNSLQNYPYECHEQMASKLIALVLQRSIDQALGRTFVKIRELNRILQRLRRGQTSEGGWGWWPGQEADLHMSVYVLNALLEARTAGLGDPQTLERGLRYLSSQLSRLKGRNLLLALDLLGRRGQRLDPAHLLASIDSSTFSLYDKLLLLRIRHWEDPGIALDTLYRYRRSTVFGGAYWEEPGRHWHDNSTDLSLLAYDLLRQHGGKEAELAAIRRYFLSQRRESPWSGIGHGWMSTFETARILQTLLPDLLKGSSQAGISLSELTLNGAPIAQWPFQEDFSAGQSLDIRKTGLAPVYLTAYQSYQNEDPAPRDDLFEVETRLEREGRVVSHLEVGVPVDLVVNIKVRESAEYVLIEAPIPAGCSYANRNQSRIFPEVHREYRREKTAIFCETLPVGNYTFRIALEPRFRGEYSLNPARVEPMYFPVFFGRNSRKKVEVK